MAFWGVVVKPGKPITHSCEKAHGRLRITQAMLGIGDATKKTIVQCNVGKRIPMLICALFPDKKESCRLELEFAEADDVVFSVIGPRSVYLTGYYVAESRISGPQSDSESFGVDIQYSHSEGSSQNSEDDDYEDSFIDDGELEVLPPTPVSSNQSMDGSDSEDGKQKARQTNRRHLRKKSQVVVSDNESDSHENDDEDGYLLSVFKNKPSEKKTTSKVQEANAQATAETGDNESDSHENDDEDGYLLSVFKNKPSEKKTTSKVQEANAQATAETGDNESDSHENDDEDGYLLSVFKNRPSEKKTNSKVQEANAQATAETGDNESDSRENDDEDGYLLSVFKNKTSVKNTMSKAREKKDQEIVENEDNANDNGHCDNKVKGDAGPHVASGQHERGTDLLQDNKVMGGKSKKKKLPKEVETCQETSVSKDKVPSDGNIQDNVEESNTNNQNVPTSDMNSQIDTGKQKKKRKERSKKEEKTCEVDTDMGHSSVKEGKELEVEASNNMGSNSGHKLKKRRKESQVEGTSTDGIVETSHVPSYDKPEQALLDKDSSMKDHPEASGVSVEQKTKNESGKKNKKRSKKKTQDENHVTAEIPANKRTLLNGVSIEVLAYGLPDGKVAVPGKKVKIQYTAMVKETGHIFYSNVGKTALKFRLGDKEFSDEWNAGIDGMHVGEKRRLVVPPSLSIKNHEENVPPNSWLMYDVVLVGIH